MIAPITGMKMSPTIESTILPKAAPMTTPTARSTTLPLMREVAKFLEHAFLPAYRAAGPV